VAAEMVSLPPRQDLVLEPHGDRAAVGAAGAQAQGAQPAAGHDRGALSRAAAERRPGAQGTTAESVLVLVLSRRGCAAAGSRAALSRALARTRDRKRARMGDRAPQRRGRARGNLPR